MSYSRAGLKKKSDRWAPGSSFEKFSDRGLSFTSQHKKFILLECLSTCCVLFPRMFEYMHVITFLNKDKLFRVLGVSPSFCAIDIKLALNRYI